MEATVSEAHPPALKFLLSRILRVEGKSKTNDSFRKSCCGPDSILRLLGTTRRDGGGRNGVGAKLALDRPELMENAPGRKAADFQVCASSMLTVLIC